MQIDCKDILSTSLMEVDSKAQQVCKFQVETSLIDFQTWCNSMKPIRTQKSHNVLQACQQTVNKLGLHLLWYHS